MNHTEKKNIQQDNCKFKNASFDPFKRFHERRQKYSYLQIVPASKNSEPRIVDSWIVDPFEEITILLVLVG